MAPRLRRLRLTAREHDGPDEVVLDHDRDADQRPVVVRRSTIRVLRVITDVRDVDRLTCHRRPAGPRRSVESVWVLFVPLGGVGVGVLRDQVQVPALE